VQHYWHVWIYRCCSLTTVFNSAQTIPPIPTRVSAAWSVSLSSVTFKVFRCDILAASNDIILCNEVPDPDRKEKGRFGCLAPSQNMQSCFRLTKNDDLCFTRWQHLFAISLISELFRSLSLIVANCQQRHLIRIDKYEWMTLYGRSATNEGKRCAIRAIGLIVRRHKSAHYAISGQVSSSKRSAPSLRLIGLSNGLRCVRRSIGDNDKTSARRVCVCVCVCVCMS